MMKGDSFESKRSNRYSFGNRGSMSMDSEIHKVEKANAPDESPKELQPTKVEKAKALVKNFI